MNTSTTADSSLLQTMLDFDTWATRAHLDACRGLDDEMLHRDHGFGRGSVHDTLLHIIAAMRRWTDRMADGPDRPSLDAPGARHSVEALESMLDEVAAELAAAAQTIVKEGRLEERGRIVIRDWPEAFAVPHGAMICHVLTHGVHHRAQIMRMLASMGVEALPDADVISMTMEQGLTTSG